MNNEIERKKIIIADDHLLFRDTLVMYLKVARPHFDVLVASDFYELFSLLKKHHHSIDFILVDYSMPTMMSREAFQKMVIDYPKNSFAMMSGVANQNEIDFVRNIGARGYIPKTLSAHIVIDIIDRLMGGETYFVKETSGQLFSLSSHAHSDHLTARENDIVDLVKTGITNKEIGDELDVKPVTVKLHIRNILRKLNLKNRTQIALWAQENQVK